MGFGSHAGVSVKGDLETRARILVGSEFVHYWQDSFRPEFL